MVGDICSLPMGSLSSNDQGVSRGVAGRVHDDLRQHNQGFTVPGKSLCVCGPLKLEADPPPCILVIVDKIPSHPQIK